MAFGRHITESAEQTLCLGKALGRRLSPNTVVAFYGDLGTGKTTFIRGLVEDATGIDPRMICSPTFTYLNVYQGKCTLYHFDLYRLPNDKEFFAAGFDEYFYSGGICCIEWAEKIAGSLPKDSLSVHLSYLGAGQRQIEILERGRP